MKKDWTGQQIFIGYLLIIPFILLLTGCSATFKDFEPSSKTPSTAFTEHEQTTIGQLFNDKALQHPGKSGFALVTQGREAFTDRIALTELAEQTLDLQYYIWESDATGRILAERLSQAADRGVRVRILVDDNNIEGRDSPIASLDAHPNIEIRVFNPFVHRSSHILDFMTDLPRINHRMHNKLMIMDNSIAIVGGRNIGNHYFDVDTEFNFRDLDVAAAGPVVRDLSGVFDNFWNGEWAIPITALVDKPYTQDDLQIQLNVMHQHIARDNYPHPLDNDISTLKSRMSAIRDNFIWAPGRVIWDDPLGIEKVEQGRVSEAFYKKMDTINSELLIESAYFIPREDGLNTVKQLTQRGVKVRVLTNSLISNDVIPAHAGYAKTRAQLITSGADIYELRADAELIKKYNKDKHSKSALHTKAMAFDRESIFVGSFNLDPRSADINTEAGLYIESPELAQQLVQHLDEGVQAENSYQVKIDDNGRLYWLTENEGEEARYTREPEASFWQRFQSGLIRLLPVEQQL